MSGASRSPGPCPEASSRCSSLGRALATDPAILLIDELSMGLAPLVVEQLYDHVRQIANTGVPILLVEQFGNDILDVADVAGIMLHGRVQHEGEPHVISDRLAAAYLGEESHPIEETHVGRSSEFEEPRMTASVNAAPPPADPPPGGRPSGTEPMSQARLDRFESEVSDLKVTGGAANPGASGRQARDRTDGHRPHRRCPVLVRGLHRDAVRGDPAV